MARLIVRCEAAMFTLIMLVIAGAAIIGFCAMFGLFTRE
jgi:hypothetical protein